MHFRILKMIALSPVWLSDSFKAHSHRARLRPSTDVDARDAHRATNVDGRRRARCEWVFRVHQIRFRSGLRLQRSPDSLASLKGPTSKGKSREGEWREGEKRRKEGGWRRGEGDGLPYANSWIRPCTAPCEIAKVGLHLNT